MKYSQALDLPSIKFLWQLYHLVFLLAPFLWTYPLFVMKIHREACMYVSEKSPILILFNRTGRHSQLFKTKTRRTEVLYSITILNKIACLYLVDTIPKQTDVFFKYYFRMERGPGSRITNLPPNRVGNFLNLTVTIPKSLLISLMYHNKYKLYASHISYEYSWP